MSLILSLQGKKYSFLPNDRMFGTAKRHIRKNERIYTPAEYENLIVKANEKFEIQRPKTEDIIDIKKWWPKHYKKVMLSVDSYGKGVHKDQKTTFAIFKASHFTFSKSTPAFTMGTRPHLPTSDTPAYADKVPINKKKMANLNKLAKYISAEYQDFYTEVFAWPTTATNNDYQENNDDY
ncbi:unnamed protein product [Psylliodes chrysocephalus]|uniref:Uncharacterized protein n=1 Tax=Psylliodes chrysocephalus TaxID=3402493 RepID=A0A9P0G6Y0_9CUCU|nr:unnamed protein product [Psylliodes chrysocephala]